MVQGRKIRYFFIGIDEENGELAGFSAQVVIQTLLLETPGFTGQALDAVTVYRMGKTPGGGAKACLHRVLIYRQLLYGQVNNTERENRKRFSFTKKRFNKFSAL